MNRVDLRRLADRPTAEQVAKETAERRRAEREREEILLAARASGAVTASQVRGMLMDAANEILAVRGGNLRLRRSELKELRKRNAIKKAKAAYREVIAEAPLSGARPPEPQSLYVIGALGEPVKIGIAVSPAQRLKEIQTGCPHRLRVYFHQEVSLGLARTIERRCHELLHQHRLSGEWFDIDHREAIELVKATIADHERLASTIRPTTPTTA